MAGAKRSEGRGGWGLRTLGQREEELGVRTSGFGEGGNRAGRKLGGFGLPCFGGLTLDFSQPPPPGR